MKKKFIVGLATSLFMLYMSGVGNANLISNGGFEDEFNGWTSTGNVSVMNYSAVFSFGNTPNTGEIFQDFSTIVGEMYSLDFTYALNGDTGLNQYLQVQVLGGQSLLDEKIFKNTTGMDYEYFNFNFIADSTTTRLNFSDASSVSYRIDIHLDDVSVNSAPVPEPATMFLLGAGLVGLVGTRIRRKKEITAKEGWGIKPLPSSYQIDKQ